MAIRLVTLFLALTVSTACAADFRRALAAYQSGKFAVALAQFRELALDGDAQAQFNLGIMYREGQGHAADPRTAARWFSRAARSGHRQAQFELGLIYDHGIGVGRNDRRAVYWYRRAAEAGQVDAQLNLGVMYATGHGVARSQVNAYAWFTLAAARGADRARENLGIVKESLSPARLREAEQIGSALLEQIPEAAPDPPPPTVTASAGASAALRASPRPAPAVVPPALDPVMRMVRETQAYLRMLGFEPGPLDGITGPKTARAIALFEHEMGLETTGRPSEALLRWLKSVVADMRERSGS